MIGRKDECHIKLFLDSLTKQTMAPDEFEVMIADCYYDMRSEQDHIKDNTYRDVKYPFTIYHWQVKSPWLKRGLWTYQASFNQGIMLSDAELVCTFGDCCEPIPEYLERMWNWYQKGYWAMGLVVYKRNNKPFLKEDLKTLPADYMKGTRALIERNWDPHPAIRDSRWVFVDRSPDGIWIPTGFHSAQNFHGYASLPLEALLKINGFDECVSPETIIYGEKIKPIKRIKIGDKILSHDGKLHNVNKVIKRQYDGDILEITPSMFSIPIKITPNHPVLTVRSKKWKKINIKPIYHSNVEEHYKNREWVRAGDINIGDYVCFPVPVGNYDCETISISDYIDMYIQQDGWGKSSHNGKNKPVKNTIQFNGDFLRLIGYYLSEGCYANYKEYTALQFTFHKNEVEYTDDVCRIVENLFGIKARIKLTKNVRIVYVGSCTIARFIEKICHHGAKTKTIPYSYINLPNEKLIELLKGLLNGDGSIMLIGKRLRITYSTASTNLAYSVMLILGRLGVTAFISKRKMKSTFGEHELYELVVSGGAAKRLAELINIHYDINKRHKNSAFIFDGYIYYLVSKINKSYYNGIVYNLEVEQAHSYVSSFTLHNCLDGDRALHDCDTGIKLMHAGYPDKVLLDKNLWIYENSHENVPKSILSYDGSPIRSNYAVMMHNHELKRSKSNCYVLTDSEIEQIVQYSIENENWAKVYDQRQNPHFQWWIKHQPVFDIVELRKQVQENLKKGIVEIPDYYGFR